ncbi:MAG TPA: hypothetical protein VH008_29665 [Pseudonocardia sp.]|nr:hypothetical protein [Pseudonocardia sp.]
MAGLDPSTADHEQDQVGLSPVESSPLLPRPRVSQSGPMAAVAPPGSASATVGPPDLAGAPAGQPVDPSIPAGPPTMRAVVPGQRSDSGVGMIPPIGAGPGTGSPSGLQPASAWECWRPEPDLEPDADDLAPDGGRHSARAEGATGSLRSVEPLPAVDPLGSVPPAAPVDRFRPVESFRPVEELPPVNEFEHAVGFRAAWDIQSDTEPHPVDDLRPVEQHRYAQQAPELFGDLSPVEHPHAEQLPAPEWAPTGDPEQAAAPQPAAAFHPASDWAASRGFELAADEYPLAPEELAAIGHERSEGGVSAPVSAPAPAPAQRPEPTAVPTSVPTAVPTSTFHPASDWVASRGFELAAEPAPQARTVGPGRGVESTAPGLPTGYLEPAGANETTGEIARIGRFDRTGHAEPAELSEHAELPGHAELRGHAELLDSQLLDDGELDEDGEQYEQSEHYEPSAGGFKPALGYEQDDDFELTGEPRLATVRQSPAVDMGATTVFGAAKVTRADAFDDESDEDDDEDATTVLAPGRARARRGATETDRPRRTGIRRLLPARPGARTIVLVVGTVVGLLVGATVLVGFGKSLWSTPDRDADTTHNATQPPDLAPPPALPTTDPAADARDRAKKQADAAKKAAEGAGSGIGTGAGDSVLSLANCTKRVGDGASLQQALAAATPGQKICAVGNMGGSRLQVSRSGTPGNPITVIGNGSTPVKGITVDASNVVVGGFSAVNPQAPGIELTGNNITVRNNTVKHPTGGDYDGLRFFGSNLKILDNTITDISPDGSGAHADCMQTFATDAQSPASQNVLINGNRCERIDNQCLIAEGPNSSAGDGSGQGRSANITFTNNTCDVSASQALQIDDVQGMKVTGNTITGKPDKAFSFQNKATGAVVAANKIAAGIGYQVGMDSSSQAGYQGPSVGGEP